MTTEKLLNLISLSKRAGFLRKGMDVVKDSAKAKEVHLLLAAQDIGENSLKKLEKLSEDHKIPLLMLPLKKDQLETQLVSCTAVLAVTDKGMSEAIKKQAEQVVNGG